MKLLNTLGPLALGLTFATGAQAATLTYIVGDVDCHGFAVASCVDGDTFTNPGTPQVDTDAADIGNSTDNFDRHSHSATNDPAAGLFFDFAVDLGGETATSATLEFNTYSLDFAFVGSATLSGSNPEEGAVFFFNGVQHSIHNGLGDATTFRDFSLTLDVADLIDMGTNTFRLHGDGLTTTNDDYSVDFARLIIETEPASTGGGGGGGGMGGGGMTPVPVPASALLMGTALAGLIGWGRRRA